MNNHLAHAPAKRQGGYMLPAIVALTAVLVATGAAFMRSWVYESQQTAQVSAAMQAYYLGQMGIVEKGFMWLRGLQASDLPIGETILQGERVPGYGYYEDVRIYYLPSSTGGDFWAQKRIFRISAVGVVQIPHIEGGRSSYKLVKRKAVLFVEVRNFVDYMYLSDEEMTWFGDRIKFWHGDTLTGRVHSNSEIAIMQDPVFYEQVSTTEDDFWRGSNYNPYFAVPPHFNAPPVEIPLVAENLRNGAAAQGHFYGEPGMTYYARFGDGICKMWRWPSGTDMDSTDAWPIVLSSSGTCIFVDAPLWMHGIVTEKVTIGSAHNIRLMNDIRYLDAHPRTGVTPYQSRHILGIVSERDVKIANTPANGRENSNGLGNNQTNPNFTDIVITAAIVALGTSFTFENQNDPDSGYVCDCAPDDRGQIWLFGSVTQMRRGYVHRSTNQSTGYLKQYRYDTRLLTQRPPCFFDVVDEEGHALFNIVQWGESRNDPAEIARGNLVRFN